MTPEGHSPEQLREAMQKPRDPRNELVLSSMKYTPAEGRRMICDIEEAATREARQALLAELREAVEGLEADWPYDQSLAMPNPSQAFDAGAAGLRAAVLALLEERSAS